MARVIVMLLCAWILPAPPPPATPPHAEPQEEDVTAAPKDYVFNPIQAENEIKVGRFYLKRRSFKAAAGRFAEAAKWNPQSAEAFLLLGQSREKMKDLKGARAAYEKYLELAPDEKDAAAIRKRLAALKASK